MIDGVANAPARTIPRFARMKWRYRALALRIRRTTHRWRRDAPGAGSAWRRWEREPGVEDHPLGRTVASESDRVELT